MITEYKVTDVECVLRIVGDWFVYLMHPTYDVKWRMRNEGRIPRILQKWDGIDDSFLLRRETTIK